MDLENLDFEKLNSILEINSVEKILNNIQIEKFKEKIIEILFFLLRNYEIIINKEKENTNWFITNWDWEIFNFDQLKQEIHFLLWKLKNFSTWDNELQINDIFKNINLIINEIKNTYNIN